MDSLSRLMRSRGKTGEFVWYARWFAQEECSSGAASRTRIVRGTCVMSEGLGWLSHLGIGKQLHVQLASLGFLVFLFDVQVCFYLIGLDAW